MLHFLVMYPDYERKRINVRAQTISEDYSYKLLLPDGSILDIFSTIEEPRYLKSPNI